MMHGEGQVIMAWEQCAYDPIVPLLKSSNIAINFHAKRLVGATELLPEKVLWQLPIPSKIVRQQNSDGSWNYPTHKARATMDYALLETYRQLGFLVEMFAMANRHSAVQKAAEFILSKQTAEGDIRGIYGNQYSPNYTAALAELLIKAGYGQDARIGKLFAWLESLRQADGGWALPFRTRGLNLEALLNRDTVQPDSGRPFSHFVTGVVLRAYAAHPTYAKSSTAMHGASLLAGRLFERDVYSDRNGIECWTRFSFPFWWTDILSALDSVSRIQPGLNTEKVQRAKDWFMAHQEPSGLFTGHLLKDRYHDLQLWYSLAVCRVLQRMA